MLNEENGKKKNRRGMSYRLQSVCLFNSFNYKLSITCKDTIIKDLNMQFYYCLTI